MSEWLKVMLEEIARKRREEAEALEEIERRPERRDDGNRRNADSESHGEGK